MHIADRAKQKALVCAPAEQQQVCEQEAVKVSLDNLATFPWIAERVSAGQMRLQGAIFDIRTGVLSLLQSDGTYAPA
jgi:carbonic anhydrase